MSGGVPAGEAVNHEPLADRELNWLVHQLEAWPTRVDPDRTTNIQYLMRAAAKHIRATPINTPTPPPSRDADVERENMRWFSDQRRLSLDFYSPMYGDDDDQSEEWRVTKESGSINDREWDVIGRGNTVFAAVADARAALQALGERG